MKETVHFMISEKDIKKRIQEIAKKIADYYRSKKGKLVLVGILKGSFIFISDLCRKIDLPHEIDFMIVSSYRNGFRSNENVRIIKDLDQNIRKKNIVIVEDVVDSGNTLKKILQILQSRKPKSIKICTLFSKPSKRKVKVSIKWIGYSIQDRFIVGYGIDYSQKYRHLPYIGYVL
ncbi:hypoxanthine phosphoribosyltransferase [Candidatus Riesia pediculicola]|uniref:hypoxanthine phosphoribosyltransferase n=1 Tax=Candidatus Riesia pediculicola TaxID=401619 RepID=UPI0009C2ADDE|nr:hypoxanthine phosphoribosyltransferase [Candidatus Riesia pediculicola]ARC54174.1 hypoxanthine phosphoribosyltransferase [Candidatus Riesia pediculicola]